jgi:hypothetical protein
MARLGDTKPCGVCGGESTLRMGQAQVASLGIVPADGSTLLPVLPVWECADCEDRQPLDGELEG